jgi:hypothetical protein
MILSLDVRRAHKGDCLLMHYGSKNDPGLVIIDGGPKDVYKPQLRPRLEQVRTARGLSKQESLPVDVLMVSHVDDDHIQGILELTEEELVTKAAHRPRLLNVLSFWHNSFDEVIGHRPDELVSSVKTQFGTAAVSGGELPEDKKLEIETIVQEAAGDEDTEFVTSSLKVLASIEQGFRLRQNAAGLGFPRNPQFKGKLIVARTDAKPVGLAPGFKMTVIGPMLPELAALFKKHQEWLEQLKAKGKSPPEALAAYVDKSIPNLSSIVVLVEAGGKSILLTGDARGDKILEGLQFVGRLAPGRGATMEVDVLKVPHHGSDNNLDSDFFERVRARHYVFSGDGEHGNPERETMKMLFDARGDEPFTIHLTYPVDTIDKGRKEDREKEQSKERIRKKKNPKVVVRTDWSPQEHSLAAFFGSVRFAPGQTIEIVDEGKAHVIDLLEPLGF